MLQAAVAGSSLIKRAGGVQQAAAAYRAVWTTAFGTHQPSLRELGAIKDLLPDILEVLQLPIQVATAEGVYQLPQKRRCLL